MSRRRRRRRDEGTGKGIALIAASVSALALILGGGAYMALTKRSVDKESGCLKDGYDTITTVLVDLTDPVTPVQAAAIKNILMKVRDAVPKYGRLEVYPLEPVATKTIAPLFAACSPGTGKDVDSKLYGNPELADKNFTKKFASKLQEVVENLQKLPPQNNSPILEGIQSVAVTSLGTPKSGAAQKHMIIISDLIHHTSQLSMYQGAPQFQKFRTTQYYQQIKPQLLGAKVDFYILARETMRDVQKLPLINFWVEYVTASEGQFNGSWPAQ
jgi:hypothetical protein